MGKLLYKIEGLSYYLLLDLTFSIGRQNIKVKQIIKDYGREKKFREDAFYWSLIVKKEYKSIADGMEWADECLQLITQKKRKK